MRLVSLARAVWVTSGRPVALRATGLAFGVAILAAIIFAPSGLRAVDLVRLLHASGGVRAALWCGWSVLATPVVAGAFDAPGTRTLRAFRPPPIALAALLVALLSAVELPLIALFLGGEGLRGEGATAAAEATFVAVAIQSSACALGTWPGRVVLAGAALLVAIDPAPTYVVPLAAILAFAGVRAAWRSATERGGVVRIVVRTHPIVALALAHFARMLRVSRARLAAAAAIVATGGGALALSLLNDPDAGARPLKRAFVVLAYPLAVACALLVEPANTSEERLRPVIAATRTRGVALGCAMAVSLAAPSSAFAGTAGAIAATAAHSTLWIAPASAAWAVGIACVTAAWWRRARRARRASTFSIGVVAIGAAATALAVSS